MIYHSGDIQVCTAAQMIKDYKSVRIEDFSDNIFFETDVNGQPYSEFSLDNNVRISIELPQSSPNNTMLSGFLELQKTGGIFSGPLYVRNKRNYLDNHFFSSFAVKRRPDREYGRTANSRVWEFMAPDSVAFVAGNKLDPGGGNILQAAGSSIVVGAVTMLLKSGKFERVNLKFISSHVPLDASTEEKHIDEYQASKNPKHGDTPTSDHIRPLPRRVTISGKTSDFLISAVPFVGNQISSTASSLVTKEFNKANQQGRAAMVIEEIRKNAAERQILDLVTSLGVQKSMYTKKLEITKSRPTSSYDFYAEFEHYNRVVDGLFGMEPIDTSDKYEMMKGKTVNPGLQVGTPMN